MNYLEYFGLQAEPFLNSTSSRVFYKSAVHGKALLQLMTAADAEGDVLLLLGDSGVGKSLLLRRVLETISEESTRAALVPVPPGGLTEQHLVRAVGHQLRLKGNIDSFSDLGESLAALAADDVKTLILVDDAHRLSGQLLGLFGELTSASIVLAGDTKAKYPQKTKFVVTPLNAEATDAFIRLRLKVAGRVQEIFSADARKLVHTITRGIPARINAVCEQALLACALAGMEKIDEASVLTTGLLLGFCDDGAHPVEPKEMHVAHEGAEQASAPAAEGVVAAKPVAKPVDSLDDVLSQLADDDSDSADNTPPPVAPPAAVETEDDELDSMMNDLAEDEQELPAPPVAARDDSDLDSMLNDLAADDDEEAVAANAKPTSTVKQQAAADDSDDLDDLLGGLTVDDDEPVAKAQKKASPVTVAADDDDLAGLLDDMGADENDDVQPAPVAAKAKSAAPALDDDLDSLLDGLSDEEEVAPAPKSKPAPANAAKKTAPAPLEEDDFDNMLSGLDDEINGGSSKGGETTSEDLDDLLGGLDADVSVAPVAKKTGTSKAAEDDLDDLLAGLDEEDAPAPKVQAKTVAAKTQPAKKPATVPADDELSDLLDSLNDDSLDIDIPAPSKATNAGKGKSKAPDNLENELDNLLEGLDD